MKFIPSKFEKARPMWLKPSAGVAAVLLVGGVFGALASMTVMVVPAAAFLVVGIGAIAAISGIMAVGAAAIAEKRGADISTKKYFSRTFSAAVSLNIIRELIRFFKGKGGLCAYSEKADLGMVVSYLVPRLPNSLVTKGLYLSTFVKVPEDQAAANASNNMIVLGTPSADGAVSDDTRDNTSCFTEGAFIENQSEWDHVKYGTTTMKYAGCEIMAVYNALLDLGMEMKNY